MEEMKITKRNGAVVPFDLKKISEAVRKALAETGEKPGQTEEMAEAVAHLVYMRLEPGKTPSVEEVQDYVEDTLMQLGLAKTAKAYILYRAEHTRERSRKEMLMDTLTGKFMDVTTKDRDSVVTKGSSGNANVDTAGPMGKMLSYGAETSKMLALETMVSKEYGDAHTNGDIHIHDLDFLPTKTLTCCQIDLEKLFKGGFSTGHGFLRDPQSIGSYAALAAIALQANQNDQHGGQSIPAFDYYMAPGVLKTFRKELKKQIRFSMDYAFGEELPEEAFEKIDEFKSIELDPTDFAEELYEEFAQTVSKDAFVEEISKAYDHAYEETNKATYQAMEGFVHNLNTMHSRAGAQVPFTSINYGTDTSPEGRMVMKNLLDATEAGLGNGETPIFPIQIFKLKEGVSYNEEDPNYDLFRRACEVSAKRLFPNFSFLDSPFNLQYYKPGHPETEATYMGCRTRVIGNVCGEETVTGRGNLSFTSINLPRLAIKAKEMYGDERDKEVRIKEFFDSLRSMMDLVSGQLLERMAIQSSATPRNFSFLMGEGIWRGSDQLKPDEPVAEVLKQGTLSIGFIGLAETLTELIGEHHGQSEEAQKLGLEIVKFMREYCDDKSQEYHLNFTLLATPAEGLSGRFTRMDRKKYGLIKGVTDKEYYTNSFHIPVGYEITAYGKIQKEAPYHQYTNAGHISYIELDGDTAKNIDAFMKIVKAEKEAGMGYAAINHPVDRDPVCGYNGVIDNVCPKCGRKECDGDVGFERIRRITGYLVGAMDKWNSAKTAEEHDRVKHRS